MNILVENHQTFNTTHLVRAEEYLRQSIKNRPSKTSGKQLLKI